MTVPGDKFLDHLYLFTNPLNSTFYNPKKVKMKTIVTDKVIVPDGADYTFVCNKVPFAVSCSNMLPHAEVNLIDLDLVNKMKIPLRNIKVTRMSLLGHDVRAVGRIKQTVQCVVKGKVHGNVHLEAKVVRDLFSLLNVDCIASAKSYERLEGREPPEPDEGYESTEDVPNLDGPAAAEDEDEDSEKEKEDDEANGVHDVAEDVPPDPGPSINPTEDQTPAVNSLPGYDDDDNSTVYNEDGYDMKPTRDQISEEYLIDENIEYCRLCYVSGEPDHVTLHHGMFHPSCPWLTEVDKQRLGISSHQPKPRRRKVTRDEELDHEELAALHGYPVRR